MTTSLTCGTCDKTCASWTTAYASPPNLAPRAAKTSGLEQLDLAGVEMLVMPCLPQYELCRVHHLGDPRATSEGRASRKPPRLRVAWAHSAQYTVQWAH